MFACLFTCYEGLLKHIISPSQQTVKTGQMLSLLFCTWYNWGSHWVSWQSQKAERQNWDQKPIFQLLLQYSQSSHIASSTQQAHNKLDLITVRKVKRRNILLEKNVNKLMTRSPKLWRKAEVLQIVEANQSVSSFKVQGSYLPLPEVTAVILITEAACDSHGIVAICQALG